MAWARGLARKAATLSGPSAGTAPPPPAPQMNPWVPAYPVPPGQSGKPYRDNWDVIRAVEAGMSRSVPIYRSVMAIANKAAKLPMQLRAGNPTTGELVDDPLLDLFNFKASPYEAAYIFRKRLHLQVLLNRQGAMVEVVRSNAGKVLALYLLPAGYSWPIPDERTFVSAFRIQLPGRCLAAGTPIVTKRGSVAVESVIVGDEVLTHNGRWRRVTATSVRPLADGERVVEIKGKGMEALKLTADHKVRSARYSFRQKRRFVGMEWVAAGELTPRAAGGHKPHDAMTVPKLQGGEPGEVATVRLAEYVHETKFAIREVEGRLVSSHRKTSPVAAEVKLTHQLGRLLGLYLAEGWTSGSRGASEMGWAFHENEVELQEEVVAALRDVFGLNAKIVDRPRHCKAVLCCSRLVANLFACGSARTKVLPEWAWRGDGEFFEGVLTGWADGDGHRRARGTGYEVSVTTVSPSLAEHMRVVAVATGRYPGLTHRSGHSGFSARGADTYELCWNECSGAGMRRGDGDSMTTPVAYVKESCYRGPVYDLTVEEDHSFLTAGGMVHNSWFDIPAQDVIWIREPHPIDPYSGLTPLEAAGLAVETDWYAKLYQRNFLLNDGRPGGIMVVQGEIEDEDADELRRRFYGPTGMGVSGAGRVSVIEGDGVQFVDTGANPRESAYMETRTSAADEEMMAYGVPKSVAGDASNRTYANAKVEEEAFWRDTMTDHLELVARCLDPLYPDPRVFFAYDLSGVEVLQRDKRERESFRLQEVQANVLLRDEYRQEVGREPLGGFFSQVWMPTTVTDVAAYGPSVLAYTKPSLSAESYSVTQSQASPRLEEKAIPPYSGNGGMVAFVPDAAVVAELDKLAATPIDEPHCTLAYLPGAKAWDAEKVTALEETLRRFAAREPVCAAEVTGVGRFTAGSDGYPVVALVSSAELPALRERLVEALRGVGAEMGRQDRFLAHITLDYDEGGTAEVPVLEQPIPLTIAALTLKIGEREVTFPLASGLRTREAKAAKIGPLGAVESEEDRQTLARHWDHRLQSWESTVAQQMRIHFLRQERVVLEKLQGRKSRERHETFLAEVARGTVAPPVWMPETANYPGRWVGTKGIDPHSIFDTQAFRAALEADAQGWITGVIADFGEAQAKALGVGFDVHDPAVTEAITNQVNRLAGVDETTYGQVAEALAAGEAQGETISELASRVQGVFAEATSERATLIARTEVNDAANWAGLYAAKQSGVVEEKSWLAVEDPRTCSICSGLDGQTVPVDENFANGEDAPGAHPACRCTMLFGLGNASLGG